MNGLGIVHGGIAFSLADSCFAFACNNRNNLSVALDTSINFTKPVHIGDVLIAEAKELLMSYSAQLENQLTNMQNSGQTGNEFQSLARSLYNAQSQIVELDKEFRGHKYWHRYSDAQIKALHKWILFIAERDNIDVRVGLPALIKTTGTIIALVITKWEFSIMARRVF